MVYYLNRNILYVHALGKINPNFTYSASSESSPQILTPQPITATTPQNHQRIQDIVLNLQNPVFCLCTALLLQWKSPFRMNLPQTVNALPFKGMFINIRLS